MKRYFFAGLALLLPVVLTLIITRFIVNLLTAPFQDMLLYFIQEHHLTLLGSPEAVLAFSKLAVLIFLFGFIVFIGLIANHFFVDYFFRFSEMLLIRIPVVNKIYKGIKDLFGTLFTTKSTYSQVVLAPYPKNSSWVVGLITKQNSPPGMFSVFVPETPNPTVGFTLLYKREQLIFLDVPADEAMRFVVSCGVAPTTLREKA